MLNWLFDLKKKNYRKSMKNLLESHRLSKEWKYSSL